MRLTSWKDDTSDKPIIYTEDLLNLLHGYDNGEVSLDEVTAAYAKWLRYQKDLGE